MRQKRLQGKFGTDRVERVGNGMVLRRRKIVSALMRDTGSMDELTPGLREGDGVAGGRRLGRCVGLDGVVGGESLGVSDVMIYTVSE